MPSFPEIMAEVLAEEQRRQDFDSPMSPNGAAPWRIADALAVPEAVPFLIEVLEGKYAGVSFAVAVLQRLGPMARAASPYLERLGEHLALWHVDEARARELGVHRRSTPWRSAVGYSARREIATRQDPDRARAHFAELIADEDVEVVQFALDALRRDSSGLFDRAWDSPSSVPIESVRVRLYDPDHDVAKAAARLLMRLHHPADAADVLAEWERTLVAPVDVPWLAPLPNSFKLVEHVDPRELFELVRRRRCAGLGAYGGGYAEWFLQREHRDATSRAFAARALDELRGIAPEGSLEAADDRFVRGHHEDDDPDASAYGEYANVLVARPADAHAAFQLAWIDREYGSPITPERIAWLRSLGIRDEELLAELAKPLTTFLPGPRTRHKLVPGTKDVMRSHLARLRAALPAPVVGARGVVASAAAPARPIPAVVASVSEPTPRAADQDDEDAPIEVVRLKPPRRVVLGEYDLDAFAIEYARGHAHLDFRFELGAGLGIFWAVPAGRGGRLRLWHVDGAAYDVDEPWLIADPWVGGAERITWNGDLASLGDGRTLVHVDVECMVVPAAYRCQIGIRGADGKVEVFTFAWHA